MPKPIRKAKMLRLIAPFLTLFLALFLTAAPALAACQGQDLRPTMTPEQRAELDAALASRPFVDGNHWLAEKDGEALHLIGTVHLQDPRLSVPIEALRPVVSGAAMVMLEMTQLEQAELTQKMARDPELIVLKDSSLPDLMSEADWQLLSEAMQARGLPPFMAAKFQPWYISMLLGMPVCLMSELQKQNGLDAQIEAIAEAAGIPTRPLEAYDAAIKVFAQTPMETQIAMMRSALVAPQIGEDLFETLMAAYTEQNHAESWLVTTLLGPSDETMTPEQEQAALDELEQTLLIDRNIAWIPVLEHALEETDGSVVAAFGAAHLSGTFGVLNLLEQKGYQLTRQPF